MDPAIVVALFVLWAAGTLLIFVFSIAEWSALRFGSNRSSSQPEQVTESARTALLAPFWPLALTYGVGRCAVLLVRDAFRRA